MIYGYIRVSTDKQTTENQRFEVLKFAHEKSLRIDRWIEETISATRKLSDRVAQGCFDNTHMQGRGTRPPYSLVFSFLTRR
jgi:hypothetical protein